MIDLVLHLDDLATHAAGIVDDDDDVDGLCDHRGFDTLGGAGIVLIERPLPFAGIELAARRRG
jgi:hypothetical protein